jgi:hypothetical protein
MGLIMEWLSPSDDEFNARMKRVPGDSILPTYVADAMKLYVEKVQPQGHISCPPAPSDLMAKMVAGGDRDKIKQDALYVRLSENGDVISVPTQIKSEMIEAELGRTKRLSDLVRPLRDGSIGPTVDYDILLEAMSFLLLDKNNRPFLILKEAGFGGPVFSPDGTTWSHSVTVLIENITGEDATCVNGHAAVCLDKEITKPLFLFNEFAVEPYTTNLCTFFVSEETHARGINHSHTLNLSIDLEYRGVASDRKYHIRMWSTYDPSIGAFKETITDLQGSVNIGDSARRDVETKWTHPTRG